MVVGSCVRCLKLLEEGEYCLCSYNPVIKPVKHDTEKNQLELLSAPAIACLGQVLTYGAKKYAPNNWRNGGGLAFTRVIGATLRHVFAFAGGEDVDPETNLPHIAHAMCCCMFLLEYVLLKRGIDDRYKST